MKKSLTILAIFAFFTSSLFAKSWTNNIGLGYSMPFSFIGINESGAKDINQIGYGVCGSYTGIHNSGLTLKADVSIGLNTTKDVTIQKSGTNFGVFENIGFGVGYAFINSEKATLGATGSLGIELSQYSFTEEDITYNSHKADSTITSSIVSASIGADLFGIYRFTEGFGIFTNITAKYILGGTTKVENKYEWEESDTKKTSISSTDAEIRGKFLIQPTIGIVWTF